MCNNCNDPIILNGSQSNHIQCHCRTNIICCFSKVKMSQRDVAVRLLVDGLLVKEKRLEFDFGQVRSRSPIINIDKMLLLIPLIKMRAVC